MRFPKKKPAEEQVPELPQAPVAPQEQAPVAPAVQPPIATTAQAPVAQPPVAPQEQAPAMSPQIVEVPITMELLNKKLNYLIEIGETLLRAVEE